MSRSVQDSAGAARPRSEPARLHLRPDEGTQLVPAILLHDRNAIGSRDLYNDEYYTAFFKAVGAVLERRLNESIAAVAAMIAGAWEIAGRPAVPADPPQPLQQRRR